MRTVPFNRTSLMRQRTRINERWARISGSESNAAARSEMSI
jgi:hypothetical protein